MVTDEQLWSPQQVADFLGVPRRTLYAWRQQNGGPIAFRIGKHLRYRPQDVVAWMEAQRDRPTHANA